MVDLTIIILFFFYISRSLSSYGGSGDGDTLKDTDADGYTIVAGDCSDSDLAINPIPNNGCTMLDV